jgi:hypothetical protein
MRGNPCQLPATHNVNVRRKLFAPNRRFVAQVRPRTRGASGWAGGPSCVGSTHACCAGYADEADHLWVREAGLLPAVRLAGVGDVVSQDGQVRFAGDLPAFCAALEERSARRWRVADSLPINQSFEIEDLPDGADKNRWRVSAATRTRAPPARRRVAHAAVERSCPTAASRSSCPPRRPKRRPTGC